MSLTLIQALRAESSTRIAFTGAGGKTTAMLQLARQFEPPVIVTATSHLGAWQIGFADIHIIAESMATLEEEQNRFQGVILVTGALDGDRTRPIKVHILEWLRKYCTDRSIPLLIEADGSRQRPLKAWANHEPPIPRFVNQVVQVLGLTGLGKTLGDDYVHRPQVFSSLSGLEMGESVTPEALIQLLKHTEGGLKNVPAGARRILLLNQADTSELQAVAHGLVQPLMSAYHAVVISSLAQEKVFAVHEPIAGIILAAGGSERYGQPKQLLDWKGKPFVRAVAMTALDAGLAPVIVVTGANSEQVETAVRDLNVEIVRNDEWKSGQGSSIKAGIFSLTSAEPPVGQHPQIHHRIIPELQNLEVGIGGGQAPVGGAIFLLTDQPQVTPSILRALVERHAEDLCPIVAPMVMDRRANPVLFDLVTFADLMTLEGDVGGRAIFHKHRVEYLPWHDDRLLLDVDTPEMYRRLVSDESL